jgi:predicted nuclease with TOPRIM domain
MKQLRLVLLSASLFFSSVTYSQGIDVQVQASLDFVELIKEVASWVEGAFKRHDKNELKKINESVPKLVGQLSALAGEKNALANYLKSFNSATSKAEFENNYKNKIKSLNEQLSEIRETIEFIDPKWTANNPMANFNVSSAVAQKELFLQNYGVPDNLFEMNLIELANAYNNEAYNLLRSSVEISNSLQLHNLEN